MPPVEEVITDDISCNNEQILSPVKVPKFSYYW